MPSPIAHVTAGYVLFRVFRKYSSHFSKHGWLVLAAFVVLSLAPDFDSAIGIISGDFGRFHNNITHSLFGAIPAALLVFLFLKVTRLAPATPWAVAAASCYLLHVGLDFFTHGRGVMALWPITGRRFDSPVLLFYGLHWSAGWLSSQHLVTIATEGIPAAIIVIVLNLKRFRKQDHHLTEDGCEP